ncbi:hypothetical protein OUZ56_000357 [Daphnia magna]|uniref:Uncharacterized protein n=1 Tax=Daphnia magna TaxID=35525 RepID=A0ABQ9ZZN1_9CRUS|nr:hypothetical protein OUZ56_000357 [Daphnia magna]
MILETNETYRNDDTRTQSGCRWFNAPTILGLVGRKNSNVIAPSTNGSRIYCCLFNINALKLLPTFLSFNAQQSQALIVALLAGRQSEGKGLFDANGPSVKLIDFLDSYLFIGAPAGRGVNRTP